MGSRVADGVLTRLVMRAASKDACNGVAQHAAAATTRSSILPTVLSSPAASDCSCCRGDGCSCCKPGQTSSNSICGGSVGLFLRPHNAVPYTPHCRSTTPGAAPPSMTTLAPLFSTSAAAAARGQPPFSSNHLASCIFSTRGLTTSTSSLSADGHGNRGGDDKGTAANSATNANEASETSTSTSSDAANSNSGGGSSSGGGGGGTLGSIQPRVMMVFTCAKCETRSTKSFSKVSYTQGVVLVRCPGCQKLHLIADHLGWFGREPFVLHEYIAKQGGNVVRISSSDPHPHPQQHSYQQETATASEAVAGAAAEAAEGEEAGGGADSDPGLAARAAAAAAAVVASQGGVFELGSEAQVRDALAEARELQHQQQQQQGGKQA